MSLNLLEPQGYVWQDSGSYILKFSAHKMFNFGSPDNSLILDSTSSLLLVSAKDVQLVKLNQVRHRRCVFNK